MVVKNLDFYNFKKLEKEYDRIKAFEIAYKATLFQLESGQEMITPPPPETLIEKKETGVGSFNNDAGIEIISDLLKMFDAPKKEKIEDVRDEKLDRIKRGEI